MRNSIAVFGRDRRAASAVEFALVAMPLVVVLLGILQVGIVSMAQTALDAGTLAVVERLRTDFAAEGTPALPSGSSLKTSLAAGAGALIRSDDSLAVEIRPLVALGLAILPIEDGVADYGLPTSPLVLRAEAAVVTVVPLFSGLARARSSAILRRQGR